MDNMLDILKDMAKAALKMSTAITYAEEHPGDPHGADDVDYSRDFVVNTIRRFQAIDPLVITLTVHSRDQLNSQAADDGIDPLETIRTAMIERRGQALTETQFNDAVLFSHAIWWLSALRSLQGGDIQQ